MKQNIPFIIIKEKMSFYELGQALVSSAFNNNLDQIKILLNHYNIPINYSDRKNNLTALDAAASQGHLNIVKYLLTSSELKEQADIHAKNKLGYNALMAAATWNHVNIVSYLLTSPELKEHSSLLDVSHYEQDILMFACMLGSIDVIKYLMETNDLHVCINPYYINKHQENSILYAYKKKHTNVLEYLLCEKNLTITEHTLNWVQSHLTYYDGFFQVKADINLKEMIEYKYYEEKAFNFMTKLDETLIKKSNHSILKKI